MILFSIGDVSYTLDLDITLILGISEISKKALFRLVNLLPTLLPRLKKILILYIQPLH